jgi:hypothetical protein
MRIRVIRKPTESCIDGVQLDRFEVGVEYDVGSTIGALFLAEGWGEPVTPDEPSVLIPFREFWAEHRGDPPNLVREIFPPYYDTAPVAALDRRRKPRTRQRT